MSGETAALVRKLDAELKALWEDPPSLGGLPTSRVCTMNIVVVASSRALLERYTPVVDEVTASIPARAILVALEPDAEGDAVGGEVAAVCSLEGDRNICSERIILTAKGAACARAASAVDAFLLPELPTALVWLGRVHVDDPVFQALAQAAHRIVLDSEYTSLASLLHVASWARTQAEDAGPAIADMAWTRIAPWHEMVARLFDGPEARPFVEHVTRVSVKQASDVGERLGPEAALFLGWLATRLGWKPARLGGKLRFARPDGTHVTVDLGAVPRPAGVAPQTLAAVAIEAQGEHGTSGRLVGTVVRELGTGLAQEGTTADADVMAWHLDVPGAAPLEQRVRLGTNKAAKWLERTLHRPRHDPAFAESVAFAEQIVEDGVTV